MVFPSDLEIARGATLTPLADVGAAMGLGPHLLATKLRLLSIERARTGDAPTLFDTD